MAQRLNEKQIAAIAIMSQPKHGLTNDQIAEEVGIARSTFYEWKKNELFQRELKAEIVRNTSDRLPEVFSSMIDNIIQTGNAAAFRTLVQMHGLLVEKVEMETRGSSTDTDAMRADIERMRRLTSKDSE